MVRYADDFVILCRTAAEAVHALDLVRVWVTDNDLTLHPTKTRIVDVCAESFAFPGYEFAGDKHWPRPQRLQVLKDTLRRQTRRTSGESLGSVVYRVNRSLRGWFAYFQHSSGRSVYQDLDG